MSRRGASLASVLALLSVTSVLGLGVAALATSQLAVSGQRNKSSLARSLAEASVSSACARILHDTQFGTHNETIEKHLEGLPADSVGWLSFDSSWADTHGIPSSLNNLKGTVAKPGWSGATVPIDQIHLMGVGRHAGVERRVEAVLYLPRFPYVLSSSGPLRSSGGLEVMGVRDAAALANGVDQVAEKDKIGGNLISNGLDVGGQKALTLTGISQIHGDLQSSGSIDMSSSVTVNGEVRANSQPAALPSIDVTQFDTAGKEGLTTLGAGSLAELTIEGYARRSGGLEISGPLDLKGGVLYVDGDLTVRGGIHGKGAVIVTGKTTVLGGGAMQTDNQAALLSKGDIVLEGSDTQRANFVGVIYTEGDFSTRNVNVAGAFVANKPQLLGGSQVQMDNSSAISIPGMSQLTVSVTTKTTSTTPGEPWEVPIFFDIAWDENVDWKRPPNQDASGTALGHPGGTETGSLDGGPGFGGAGFNGLPGANAVGGAGGPDPNASNGNANVFGSDFFAPPGATFSDRGTISFDGSSLPPGTDGQAMLSNPDLAWSMVTAKMQSGTYQGQAFLDYVQSKMNATDFQTWKDSYQTRLIRLAAGQTQQVPAVVGGTSAPSTQTYSTAHAWTMDLSRFIKESDRLRILMWRDL